MRRSAIWVVLGLVGAVGLGALLSLAALAAFGVLGSRPTAEPTQLITPGPPPGESPASLTGSIQGIVWHDLCALAGGHADRPLEPSPGCAAQPDGRFAANGILESGEPGLGGALVQLGSGACPSVGLVSASTASDGAYVFSGLGPGTYCVSVAADQQPLMQMQPGVWTSPPGLLSSTTAYRVVELLAGQPVAFIDFGWDYSLLPVADAPAPDPTFTPTPPVSACLNRIEFVLDVTASDNSRFSPGEAFTKTWRLRNAGSCDWSPNYELAFASGHIMGGSIPTRIGTTVAVGSTIDLSVALKAPLAAGTYRANFMLRTPEGVYFGLGPQGEQAFWVQIAVAAPAGGWYGEYFDNRTLSGAPAAVRFDPAIDFNWGRGEPIPGIPSDNFSVRWSLKTGFEAATYRFTAISDDGVRLWVDNKLVLDGWRDQDAASYTVDVPLSKAQHDLRLEYYDRTKEAEIRLSWSRLGSTSFPNWKGEYFSNRDLRGTPSLIRNDQSVDFNWGNGGPDPFLPFDNFSVRWTSRLAFESARYRFNLRADDGVRLYVNNVLLINEWHDSGASTVYSIESSPGTSADLVIEYYERSGQARVQFWFEKLTPATTTATPSPTSPTPATATPTPTLTPTATASATPTPTATEPEPQTPTPTEQCPLPSCAELANNAVRHSSGPRGLTPV